LHFPPPPPTATVSPASRISASVFIVVAVVVIVTVLVALIVIHIVPLLRSERRAPLPALGRRACRVIAPLPLALAALEPKKVEEAALYL
jgi:hypothetical protein